MSVSLRLVPLADIVSPPLSSRVLKYLIDKGVFLGVFRDLSLSRDRYKGFFLSNLAGPDGRRLYSSLRGGLYSPRVLSRGAVYSARVAAVVPREALDRLFSGDALQGVYEVELGGLRAPVEVSVSSIEVVGDLDTLSIDLSGRAVIRFLTPVVLSPKLMLPPSLAARPRYRRLRTSNSLLPVPGMVYAYAMRLWNTVMPPEKRLTHPNDSDDVYVYKVSVLGTVYTEVIDYSLRPVTVAIGRDEKERLRETRGFTGYMVIRITHPTVRRVAERVLALARYLGIGRGRGIGLGEIEVETGSV